MEALESQVLFFDSDRLFETDNAKISIYESIEIYPDGVDCIILEGLNYSMRFECAGKVE